MSDVSTAFELRKKYNVFRILVIGRANAGKTTLLKRVCNTDEEPCIYENHEGKKINLIDPTEERGLHDINRSFIFRSNPHFVFHDSPGFEAGSENELKQVLEFIEKRSKATEPDDQLHVIWFCFDLYNKARLLLELEYIFFNQKHIGNVPVIAIYTRFDLLYKQLFRENKNEGIAAAREQAKHWLSEKLQVPLFSYKSPPKGDVLLEKLHDNEGNHQEQVKVLMEKTAGSLDNLALKMLFVSVQKNNLELCIKYAVDHGLPVKDDMYGLVRSCLIWFRHSFRQNYNYESMDIETERERTERKLELEEREERRKIEELEEERFEFHQGKRNTEREGLKRLKLRREELRTTRELFELTQEEELEERLRLELLDRDRREHHIASFLLGTMQKPSLLTFSICLICCIDSSWVQSHSDFDQISFENAFQQAFHSMRKEVFQTIQNSIEKLGPAPNGRDRIAMETFKSEFAGIVISCLIQM